MQVMSNAIAGMQSAQSLLAKTAARTAVQPLEGIEQAIVQQIQAKSLMQASVAVAQTSDELTGTLLNITA